MGFGIVYLVVYGKFDLNREPKFGDLETYCVVSFYPCWSQLGSHLKSWDYTVAESCSSVCPTPSAVTTFSPGTSPTKSPTKAAAAPTGGVIRMVRFTWGFVGLLYLWYSAYSLCAFWPRKCCAMFVHNHHYSGLCWWISHVCWLGSVFPWNASKTFQTR